MQWFFPSYEDAFAAMRTMQLTSWAARKFEIRDRTLMPCEAGKPVPEERRFLLVETA